MAHITNNANAVHTMPSVIANPCFVDGDMCSETFLDTSAGENDPDGGVVTDGEGGGGRRDVVDALKEVIVNI